MRGESSYFRVSITDEMKDLADRWSWSGNEFSIRHGAGSFVGSLAEVVFSKMYPASIRISHNDRHADFILKELRVDVKCKERTVYCLPSYDVSVEARQINYTADMYAFFSYNNRKEEMEFLGWISKEDFINKSRLIKSGDVDLDNNWEVSVDCYNLPVSKLIKNKKL